MRDTPQTDLLKYREERNDGPITSCQLSIVSMPCHDAIPEIKNSIQPFNSIALFLRISTPT